MSLIVTQGYGPDGAAPSPPDESPTITVISPTPSSVLTKTTPVVIQVTDAGAIRRVFVYAYYSGLDVWEVVHDGINFSPTFAGASTRTILSNGYQYTMLRNGGWPGSPSLKVYAVNTAGNGTGL